MNIAQYEKLPESFYTRGNVVQIAQELLGKILITNINGDLAAGRIVETEAYCGRNDKACHAYNKRTSRTEIMYAQGGRAYVYLCYGIHHLFNVVTNQEGLADAVLIRAIEPIVGVDLMLERLNKQKITRMTAGPGLVAKAMGINKQLNGKSLIEGDARTWIATNHDHQEAIEIVNDTRIGVDYAGEDALRLWRFYDRNSKFVSKKKKP